MCIFFCLMSNVYIMENIVFPNSEFDFSKLTLEHPTALSSGAYFTQMLYNNVPIYIQTSRSTTKQGVVKNGKKLYCDLVFDNTSEELIHWFEKLETKCQDLLFEKNKDWFEDSLDTNDIDNTFNSILKTYKSGKCHLLKTNIIVVGDNPALKVYNENTESAGTDSVKSETNIMTIIEICGIKFTPRSFQVIINLKQIMILENNVSMFETCIIKTPIQQKNTKQTGDSLEEIETMKFKESVEPEGPLDHPPLEPQPLEDVEGESEPLEYTPIEPQPLEDVERESDPLEYPPIEPQPLEEPETANIHLDIEDLVVINDLTETDLDIDVSDNKEPFKLKSPNNVYLDLYRDARNKAKVAKKTALLAYLEVKNIKKTYMINTLDDDDSDFDDEIDEVSESELDYL